MPERRAPAFAAVLEPHRSLGRTGFAILMAAVAAVGLAAGGAFAIAGAWPVSGFFGLDVALVWFAFRASHRNARMRETLRLTAGDLTVTRVGPGRRRGLWRFQPYWLRVEMDDPPGHWSQLTLASHGRRLVIGAFLTPGERLEVAHALGAALEALKVPGPASEPARSVP